MDGLEKLSNDLRNIGNLSLKKPGMDDIIGLDRIYDSLSSYDENDYGIINEYFVAGLCEEDEDFYYDLDDIFSDFLDRCGIPVRTCFEYQDYFHAAEFNFYILRAGIMFNAAMLHDAGALVMWRYVFRTYYPKEYNEIKRFKKVSLEDIWGGLIHESIHDPSYIPNHADDVVRSGVRKLCMARILGAEVSLKCLNFASIILRKIRDREDKLCDAFWDAVEDGVDVAWNPERWTPENDMVLDDSLTSDITDDSIVASGIVLQYLFKKILTITPKHSDTVKTLIGKTAIATEFKKAPYLYRFIYLQADACDCKMDTARLQFFTYVWIDAAENFENEIRAMRIFYRHYGLPMEEFQEITWYLAPTQRYEPSKVAWPTKKGPVPGKMKDAPAPEPMESAADPGDKDEEIRNLERELRELRKDCKGKERLLANALEELKGTSGRLSELENEKKQWEAERKELGALREYLLDEEDGGAEETGPSLDEMIVYLQNKRVCLIGGHENWVKKMRELFPKWRYYECKSLTSRSTDSLKNDDYIYMFTDHLDHPTYRSCLLLIRDLNLPFGYLHSINMDRVIRRMYHDLTGGNEPTGQMM